MTANDAYAWGQKLPTLTGGSLHLRWLEKRDIPALFDIFGDEEVTRYCGVPQLTALSGAEDLLGQIRTGFRERSLFQWGVALAETDEVIGTCTLFHFSWTHRRCELGFALAKKRWGLGDGGRAARSVLNFAFERLGLHRVEADADPRNVRSLALLERLGFRREGLLRERYIVNGEVQDGVMLGLLRSEFRRLP